MSGREETSPMAFFVAIEGIDGSGKGTQAARLQETLTAEGHRVSLLSFPRYDATLFGKTIGEFLNGKFGSLDEVHPQLASLLFAGDRFESRDVIQQALKESDVVICDRYVASNVAHQAAKLDEPERSELMTWIMSIEHEVYALPHPDLTLLLDLPAGVAQRLIAKKTARTYTEKSADLQEADAEYLERVRNTYLDLAACDKNWRRIEVLKNEDVRSVDDIADQIARTVRVAMDLP